MDDLLNITIMDERVDDKAIAGDIICIVNIEIEKILEWIDRHKRKNYIDYKGKRYSAKDVYPNVFIFENRNVLDKFVKSLKLSEDSLYGFMLQDIIYALSSSMDRIKIIKSYNSNSDIENINNICGIIDTQSFEDGEMDGILKDSLIIVVKGIGYKYKEIFYCAD